MKSLSWSSVAIVTSSSLSSVDIFTSSSDLNYLLYSSSIEMLCLARQSQLALNVKKFIPLTLQSISTSEIDTGLKIKMNLKVMAFNLLREIKGKKL